MQWADYKQILILVGTTLAVYLGFRYLLPLVVPFLFSYLIAIWVYPIVVYLKKKWKLSGGISAGILMICFTGIIGFLIFYLGKILFGQVRNVLSNMSKYETIILQETQDICSRFDSLLGVKVGNTFQFVSRNIESGMAKLEEEMLPLFSTETIGGISKAFHIFWLIFVVIMGAFFIVKDMEDLKIMFQESSFFSIANRMFGNMGKIGTAYLKAEFLIMLLCAIVCSSGLALLKIQNSLLWGIGISLFDALPALGSGIILIPWAIFSIIKGNWYHAGILFATYMICQLVHEIVEAKILGEKMGTKAVFTLISMYVGTELFGVAGFILGPFGFLMIKNVVQSQY